MAVDKPQGRPHPRGVDRETGAVYGEVSCSACGVWVETGSVCPCGIRWDIACEAVGEIAETVNTKKRGANRG